MRGITTQLMALPDTLEDDPQPKLLSLCGDFTYELSQFVDGSSNQPEYYVQMKPHFKLLKTMIEETLPRLNADASPDGTGKYSHELSTETTLTTRYFHQQSRSRNRKKKNQRSPWRSTSFSISSHHSRIRTKVGNNLVEMVRQT